MHLNAAQIQMIMSMLGIMFAMFVLLGVMVGLAVKFIARGKVSAIFWDHGKVYSVLLPEDTKNRCVWIGKSDDEHREKYKLDAAFKKEVKWPGGLPWFFQERIRAWCYVKGIEDPIDPEGKVKSVASAKIARMISDETLLRTMWRDLRQSVGAGGAAGPMSMQMMLFFGLIAFIAAIGAVMSYNVSKQVVAQGVVLHQIYQMLGGK